MTSEVMLARLGLLYSDVSVSGSCTVVQQIRWGTEFKPSPKINKKGFRLARE
jgi:hypothetical protein